MYINYNNIPRLNNSKIDYQKELMKYRNSIVALKNNVHCKKKNCDQFGFPTDNLFYLEPINFWNIGGEKLDARELLDYEITATEDSNQDFMVSNDMNRTVIDFGLEESEQNTYLEEKIEEKIARLETEPMLTFQEEYGIVSEPELEDQNFFLYHGIRYGNPIEVLEKILKSKKLLAGKYIDGYYCSSDNCNDGEYVSVMNYNDSYEFEQFVENNLCFVISPFVTAYKTKYLSCEEWDYMKERKIPVKNRYSYARYEYQVKDEISLDRIKAIGISGKNLLYRKMTEGYEVVNQYLRQIADLLEKYDVNLPIVDIDCCNMPIPIRGQQKVKTN